MSRVLMTRRVGMETTCWAYRVYIAVDLIERFAPFIILCVRCMNQISRPAFNTVRDVQASVDADIWLAMLLLNRSQRLFYENFRSLLKFANTDADLFTEDSIDPACPPGVLTYKSGGELQMTFHKRLTNANKVIIR